MVRWEKIRIFGHCVCIYHNSYGQIVFKGNEIIGTLHFQWKIQNGKTVKAI